MVRILSPEEWKLVQDIVCASQQLQANLENKGFEVINTFETGNVYPACITFIVKRNKQEVFSACILDIIKDEARVKCEIFERADECLSMDYDALEIDILKKRIAELEQRQKPACGGCH